MKTSQQNKILDLLSDNEFHCTSEMAALFMVDYRRRLVDLQRKGYQFENRRCTKHNHPMKEWKLCQTQEIASPRSETAQKVKDWADSFKTPIKAESKELTLF